MKDSQDDRPGPAYNEAELEELAKFLGKTEPSDELAGRMQRAAQIYEVMAGFDELHATRAQRRAVFKRIDRQTVDQPEQDGLDGCQSGQR